MSTEDGRSTIVVPAGAVDGNTIVVISPKSSTNVPALPSSFRLGSNLFSVETYYNGTSTTTFRQPVTVRAKYSAADLAAAGNDSNRLSLAYYSPISQLWLPLPTKVWPNDSVVEASTTQATMFGVVIGQTAMPMATTVPPIPRALPRTGDSVDWITALLMAGIASVTAGLVARQVTKFRRLHR